MKKILALAAAAALAGGVSVLAANPFSDVTPDDWAYQAVSDLSDQGVVEGYPDGTFKGERNMTRYELAQIIARLMAKEDQLNAEQRATLDKLAGEYADELANLGVRVGNLEKKVGNIYWSGDARMRYQHSKYNADGSVSDKWNGRMRINVKGQVNDSTYVQGRFVSNMDFKNSGSADTKMDLIYAHHQFGDKFAINLGRKDLYVGQTNIFFDDYFDGVQAVYGDPALTVEAGYGRMHTWNAGEYLINTGAAGTKKDEDTDGWYARVYGNSGRLGYDVEYYDFNATAFNKSSQKIWGAGLTAGVTKDLDIFGDYYQNTSVSGDPHLWTAGIGIGHANRKKPGTWRLAGQYVDVEKGAYLGGTTYHIDPMSLTFKTGIDEVKYWLISGDVVLQKNVTLHGEYALDVDTDGSSKVDYDDLAALVINYKF